MTDTLVSARMPLAKKEAAVSTLNAMGSSVSELINSAFDYVIEHNELPPTRAHADTQADHDWQAFRIFMGKSTVPVKWPDDFPEDYKEIISKGRFDDYESLA